MGRKKIENKKIKFTISICKELFDEICKNYTNKSKYIESLIKSHSDFKYKIC
jgi:hypothetical protein